MKYAMVSLALCLCFASRAEAQPQFDRTKRAPAGPYLRKVKEREPIAKNDLVLIVVREQTTGDMDADLQANRKTEVETVFDSFVRFSGLDLKPDTKPQPNVEWNSEVKTQGRGRTNRNDSIQTRITARVIEILPNGTVRLEAQRERTINDETTVLTLTGEASTESISEALEVSSDRIADLKLRYSGTGPVSSRTGWSWVNWLLDHIWPF